MGGGWRSTQGMEGEIAVGHRCLFKVNEYLLAASYWKREVYNIIDNWGAFTVDELNGLRDRYASLV